MIRKQKSDLLLAVVDQLKPRYSELIKLRYFSQYSYEEIAAKLNLPMGTLKAQLFRAKELLYNIIKTKEV
jgi:RNA polymerase sigma-70 factor (ECF subfamily)